MHAIGSPTSWHPRGRASLPVRAARCGEYRAPAAQRHAVPTTFYLTCPRAASRIGTLEGSGLMKQMQERLAEDPELAAHYRRAHSYLAARPEIGRRAGLDVPEIEGISAGGMPDRVKCLHVLAGQSLAQGRGVNPLGDEVLDLLGEWWAEGPCVDTDSL